VSVVSPVSRVSFAAIGRAGKQPQKTMTQCPFPVQTADNDILPLPCPKRCET
jgi:hypothetical protein